MKERFSTIVRLTALVISVAFLAKAQAAYSVKERGITLDDRFETEEMLRPFGHDFIFDLSFGLNKNVLEVYDDAKKVSETEGDNNAQIAAGQEFLRKYRDTEQTIRLGLNLGIPLPTFSLFEIKIVPDFRFNFNLLANIGIKATPYNIATVLDYVGQDIPQQAKQYIIDNFNLVGPGQDIIQKAIIEPGGVPQDVKDAAQPYVGKYFRPTNDDVPNLLTYAKADAKAGFLFNYEVDEHFFGYLNLYGMGRADTELVVTADSLASDKGDAIDFGEELNTTIVAAADYQFGYRNGNLRAMASVEELKIADISDNKEKGGELNYKIKPLVRLHSDYRYDFLAFTLRPFVGAYKRSGYNQAAQPYGGVDFGTYVWDDRMGVQVRAMADEEHLTLAPRIKLWLMQLEYSLKQPIKTKIDDTKISTLHSLNFRLFF